MHMKTKIKKMRIVLNLLGCNDLKIFKFFACFLAINFFFIAPSYTKTETKKTKDWSIEPQEKKWLEKFFSDIMLQESGIYSLLGSKPLTMIVLDLTPEEKIREIVDQMSEEEKKEFISWDTHYDLPENWQKWEKISSRYPIRNYLLFKKSRKDDPLFEDIYFINIRETAFVIEENYDLFKRFIIDDFDPLEVVFEIGDERSTFWNTVVHNSTLLGILFGFGRKNSQCFDWKYWSLPENNEPMRSFTDSLRSTFSSNIKDFKTISIGHFGLPCFASFSPKGKDEVIKKYENERKMIQKHYKKKDFVIETLKKLTSE